MSQLELDTNGIIERLGQRIGELTVQIATRDQALAQLQQTVVERDAQIAELEAADAPLREQERRG